MPEMEKGRAPENKRSRKPAHPVKRDVNEDMKNFAENTMNELLGWYGYDHVDLRDSPDSRHQAKRNHISVLKENSVPKPNAAEKNVPSSSSEPVKNNERESAVITSSSSSSSSTSPRSREQHNMNVVVPLIKPSAVEDVQNVQIICVWCQKEGIKRYSLLMGSDLKSFCSEKCFAACRRAYFKRNKARDEDRHGDQSPPPGQTLDTPTRLLLKMNSNTRVCDWCKHIRHTKEYLDFGSGEERVQFCSTKCLNQYKMDVFYREARAALNGSDSGSKDEENNQRTGDNQKLLTPESWDSSPAKTLSPKTPTPVPTSVSVLNTASSSSSARTPVTTSQSSRSCPLQIQTNTADQQRPPHITLPFVRPPLHALGLRSPAPHLPRNPASPIQRPPHPPPFAPLQPPPLLQPYPAPYVPFHPAYPPQLPPPWPQPTMLLPYPVIVPLPVPIPIPIPVPRHAGVIRSLREQEEKDPCDVASDPGETSGDQVQPRIKREQTASPLTVSLPSTSVGSSERQVIQCLRRHAVKEEVQDGTTTPSTPENPTHVYTHVLRKALKRHAGNVMSVVTPIASASSDDKTVTPASLYSLARSTAAQVASVSLDATHRSGSASDVTTGSAQIPSPLSDCEDVKENSYLSGRENGLTDLWSAEQTDCQSDQSKESVVTEDSSQDAEHTYARSVPPKLREKNTHVTAQTTTQTHSHTQTHSWEKNTHTVHQSSEPNGRDDPEPALKRRCLRIRDQNK